MLFHIDICKPLFLRSRSFRLTTRSIHFASQRVDLSNQATAPRCSIKRDAHQPSTLMAEWPPSHCQDAEKKRAQLELHCGFLHLMLGEPAPKILEVFIEEWVLYRFPKLRRASPSRDNACPLCRLVCHQLQIALGLIKHGSGRQTVVRPRVIPRAEPHKEINPSQNNLKLATSFCISGLPRCAFRVLFQIVTTLFPTIFML